jgi:hypothetical protein
MAGAMLGRGEAQVMRLACLYAVLDQSNVIRLEHLQAALAVWSYAEASVRYIFGDSTGDPVADEILRALKNCPDGMTRTELHNLFGRHQPAGRISKALTLLLEHGLARRETEQTGGKPAERWWATAKKANLAK